MIQSGLQGAIYNMEKCIFIGHLTLGDKLTRENTMKLTLIFMVTQIRTEDEPSWNYIQGN